MAAYTCKFALVDGEKVRILPSSDFFFLDYENPKTGERRYIGNVGNTNPRVELLENEDHG